MLGHRFEDRPGKLEDGMVVATMMLRCVYCAKTPSKAREDGCAAHELEDIGHILLSEFNPEGIVRFADRVCVSCHLPIMGHWLRRGLREYFCNRLGEHTSDGITDCMWDVPDNLGVQS